MNARAGRILGYRKDGRPIRQIAGAAPNPVLDRLIADRQRQLDFVANLLEQADTQNRALEASELANLNAAREAVERLNGQIEPLEAWEKLRDAADAETRSYGRGTPGAPRPITATPREHTYASVGEVIVDRIRAAGLDANGHQTAPDQGAVDRLRSANLALPGGLPAGAHAAVASGEARAHVLTSDIPGLLPKPIIGQIVSDIDAARPFVTSVGVKDMGGTPGKTFTRPVVTQSTEVGEQTAEKTELPSRPLKVGGVDFTKRTFGGWVNVSRQTIDWSSPAAWDAIVTDLQDQYAIETEAAAVETFDAAVAAATITVGDDTLRGWATSLYSGAAAVYGSVKRLPSAIWVSLDMWATIGPITDVGRLVFAGGGPANGDSSLTSFAGNVMDLPRIVVPSLPAGSLIVGSRTHFEAYEDRIGLLSVVEPSVLGVQIAYGGYFAAGAIKPGAFAAITGPTPAP